MHPLAAHARASASATGGGAGSPRKHDRRPPPGNDRSEPGALRPLGPRDLDPPASPAGARRPLAAASGRPGPLARRLSAGSQTCGRPRARAPRLDTRPPRLAVPAPPPSCRAPRQGPAPPFPAESNPPAATCLQGWESPPDVCGGARPPGAQRARVPSIPPSPGRPQPCGPHLAAPPLLPPRRAGARLSGRQLLSSRCHRGSRSWCRQGHLPPAPGAGRPLQRNRASREAAPLSCLLSSSGLPAMRSPLSTGHPGTRSLSPGAGPRLPLREDPSSAHALDD